MRYKVEKRSEGYFVLDTEHQQHEPWRKSYDGVVSFSPQLSVVKEHCDKLNYRAKYSTKS